MTDLEKLADEYFAAAHLVMETKNLGSVFKL